MIRLALLAGIVVTLAGPIRAGLVRATWTERAPRAAIALWQAVACAVGLAFAAAVVEAVALPSAATPSRRVVTDFSSQLPTSQPAGGTSPQTLFLITAILIGAALVVGALLIRAVDLTHARTQRRLLIDLVSTEYEAIPGVRVLPHPEVAAFSLAGVRPRVVLSAGTIDLLAPDELAAVLAHERAHVHARHDFVLLPFAALAQAFPTSRAAAGVRARIGLLVELAADDRALREGEPAAFVRALSQMATRAPLSGRGSVSDEAPRRAARALMARRGSKALAGASVLATGSVLVLPALALLLPLGGR